MDQVQVIRHQVLVEERSQRAVAREWGISRVTVRKYLSQTAPVRREPAARGRPVWDAVAPPAGSPAHDHGRPRAPRGPPDDPGNPAERDALEYTHHGSGVGPQ